MKGQEQRVQVAYGLSLVGLLAGVVLSIVLTGCTTKNYVRAQTAPIIQQANDLDTKTAADHRAILDADERSQRGIAGAQSSANAADQHALAAGQSAEAAGKSAQEAYNRVDSLSGIVANLDTYKALADVSVTFGFDKAVLTAIDRQELDGLASKLASTRGYILQVTGGTDSIGDAGYNYRLSQRRADAVVQYLAAKYGVPPHRFYLVGIGKDMQVASDKTASGRARNRRVQVQLLSNMTTVAAGQASGGR